MATTLQLETALRERIRADVGPGNFDAANWKDRPFRRFYGDDDELVNIVIFETTERVVNEEDKTLPVAVWQALIEEVSPDTLPKEAIPKMRLASLGAQFMVGDDEGLDSGRPRRPPTLRNRAERDSNR